jgi:hypothetical protein
VNISGVYVRIEGSKAKSERQPNAWENTNKVRVWRCAKKNISINKYSTNKSRFGGGKPFLKETANIAQTKAVSEGEKPFLKETTNIAQTKAVSEGEDMAQRRAPHRSSSCFQSRAFSLST